MDFKDYYATLGVAKSASEKEIKQAFRRLARKLHPGQVDPGLLDQKLDPPQAVQFLARVEAHAADRPRRLDQPEALIFPQRLRMHSQLLGSRADKKEVVQCHRHRGPRSAQANLI